MNPGPKSPRREQSALRILSGEARGFGPALIRALLWVAERFYIVAVWIRNWLFDAGIKKPHRIAECVISIGNITTGGTGKTPAVQWIARRLIAAGHRPACLLRGYKQAAGIASDEASLLARSLKIPVGVNPNRVAEASRLLREHPDTDVILLDDGFQHRRVWRDLNLVLIDATNPFGYGHVLPRGLLREPPAALRRADAVILTRCDQVEPATLQKVTEAVQRHNPRVLKSCHRITSGIDAIQKQPIFAFCGIGNPASFHRQLLSLGAVDAGHEFFDDHHAYSSEEIVQLSSRAKALGAAMMFTTEKDWVKIEQLSVPNLPVPIAVAQMELEFLDGDDAVLWDLIEATVRSKSPAPSAAMSE